MGFPSAFNGVVAARQLRIFSRHGGRGVYARSSAAPNAEDLTLVLHKYMPPRGGSLRQYNCRSRRGSGTSCKASTPRCTAGLGAGDCLPHSHPFLKSALRGRGSRQAREEEGAVKGQPPGRPRREERQRDLSSVLGEVFRKSEAPWDDSPRLICRAENLGL